MSRAHSRRTLRRLVTLLTAVATVIFTFALPPLEARASSWVDGGLFLGVSGGKYQVRSQTDGTLKDTLTFPSPSSPDFTTGCVVDKSGDVYTTAFARNQVFKFSGTHPHSSTAFGSGFNTPESVAIDASGRIYVGNVGRNADIPRGIQQFDTSGAELKRILPTTRVDWFDIAPDQDTIYYTQEGTSIKRVSISTGEALSDFTTDTATDAHALRILPDGGVLLADIVNVKRYNSSGTVVQTYDFDSPAEDGWFSLNLDPNGSSFWAGSSTTSRYYRFHIVTGALEIGPRSTGTASGTFFGICVKGELTAAQPIVLKPVSSRPGTGTEQTLTATIFDLGGVSGKPVTFTVESGPNTGSTDRFTDANGQASVTYTSPTIGIDVVKASFKDSSGHTQTSNTSSIFWNQVVGIARCRAVDGSTPPLPGAAVALFTGSAHVADTTANADTAAYRFTGLSPNTSYTVGYTSADGATSCAVSFTTDATGSADVGGPDVAYLKNSTWLHPFDLRNGVTQADSVPSGKSRWYRLSGVPAQSQVNVGVTAAEVDLTLVAYRDVRAVATRLNALAGTPDDVQQLTSLAHDIGADDMAGDDMAGDDMAGDDMAGDDMAGDDMAGDDMAGDDMAGDDMAGADLTTFSSVYTTAQPPSVIAISATPGHAAEFLSLNARSGGDLYFRVRKSVRELSPAAGHFAITATYIPAPGCDTTAARAALAKKYTPSAPSSMPTGKMTLMLTNTQRFGLSGGAKNNFLSMLKSVAAQPYVNGVVYDLADNAGIMAAYNDWAGSPTCVELANRVTDVIKDLVNLFRKNNLIQYGVNAGGDRIVPLRRVLDRVPQPLKTEIDYSPPLAVGTAVDASLAGDYYLTADFYAASAPITRFGGEVWLPEFSWGILVETPDDIKAYLDTFVAAFGAVQNPGKALSMGFDWNADMAQAIADDLDAGTSGNATAVIAPPDPLYSASDIRSNLTSSWLTAGYLGVQGHATATTLKAADNATRLYTTDIAGIAAAAGSGKTTGLVVTLGCHSSFNIQDADVTNPLVQKLAWPETFLAQGKTLLGGTGYQYAETVLIKNTERLLTLFTHELRFNQSMDRHGRPAGTYTEGQVPIGTAHVNAKRLYMSELTSFTALDQKVLGVSQIFGMPMLTYDLPDGRINRPAPDRLGIRPSEHGTAGLSFAPVNQAFDLHECTGGGCSGPILLAAASSTPSYFAETPELTHAVPFRPIIARNPKSVDADEQTLTNVARGVVITDATFEPAEDVTPLTVLPVTEQPGTRPPYVSKVFAPWPVALNGYLNQQLVWMPTQYVTNADGSSVQVRKFNNATTRVYYSSLLNGSALVDAPLIRSVSVLVVPPSGDGHATVKLVVTVQARKTPGIEDMWATALGHLNNSGSCDTTLIGSGPSCFVSQKMVGGAMRDDPLQPDRFFLQDFTLGGTISCDICDPGTAGPEQWGGFFQVVGGNGVVRLANNLGSLYHVVPQTATAETPKIATHFADSPRLPTSAQYRSVTTASAKLIESSSLAPVPDKPVTFRLGSVFRVGVTNDTGVATVQLAIEVTPRITPYQLLVGFAEDDGYLAAGFSQAVTVGKAPTAFNISLPSVPTVGTSSATVAKLCLSSDTTCRGPSDATSPTPVGLSEQLVQIDLNANGRILTTTDGFGQLRVDPADWGGLAPGVYNATISSFENRLYRGATANVTFTVAGTPTTYLVDHAVQGQGTFTTDSQSFGFTPGNPATFEFQLSLPKGTSAPTGNLGFHVKAQNFDFAGTSYNSMTINGTQAIVDGAGTVSTSSGQTTGVHFRMIVDDITTGDKFEIRIGPPSWTAKATNLKNSAVTIK